MRITGVIAAEKRMASALRARNSSDASRRCASLERLGGVGLDRGHAGEVVVQARRERRGGLARRGIARRQPALEPERAEQDQRHRQQRQHRKLGGEHEEHSADQQR